MNSRLLKFENLESRRLLAMDAGVDVLSAEVLLSAAESRSIESFNFYSQLSGAFFSSNNDAFKFGDTVILPVGSSIQSFRQSDILDGNFEPADELTFDGLPNKVLEVSDGLFLVSSGVRPSSAQLRTTTTIGLVAVNDSGELALLDSISRNAGLDYLDVDGDFIRATWHLNPSYIGSVEEFSSEVQFEGLVYPPRLYGVDILAIEGDRIQRRLSFGSEGFVASHSAGRDGIVLETREDIVFFHLSNQSNEFVVLDDSAEFEVITSATQMADGTLVLTGGEGGNFQSVHYDGTGRVVKFESARGVDGPSISPNAWNWMVDHKKMKELFNNGLVDAVTAYRVTQSDDIAVVTDSVGEPGIQRISLPHVRTGFRPAFVVDRDAIIVIRTDVSALEAVGFDRSAASEHFVAYLLRRDGNGEFKVTDTAVLPDLKLDAASVLQQNTLTLQSDHSSSVLRVDGDSLLVETFASEIGQRVFGFENFSVAVSLADVAFRVQATTESTDAAFANSAAVRDFTQGENLDSPFSPWTHPLDAHDVSGDGVVTARDALMVINQLNRSDESNLAEIGAPPILAVGEAASNEAWHLDATGDGFVTARDALVIINRLNRQESGVNAEGEATVSASRLAEGESGDDERIEFDNDFARFGDTLNHDNSIRRYRFIATNPRVSVDLNSVQDEGLAVLRILDANGQEITSSEEQAGRLRYEGIDFPTQAGAEYTIEVELADPQQNLPDGYSFALSVFQFEPARWLPSSSDEITVVDGPDGGDLADTIAEATDIAIRAIGSSFVQTLEEPSDVDVLRLPNALPGSVFVSGLDGIQFELLDREGSVLDRQNFGFEQREKTDIGYYTVGQADAFPFVYLRIFSTTDAVGQYNVSVLFDGHGETPTPPQGGESIITQYEEGAAEAIAFIDNQAVIEGSTTGGDDVAFYRFTSEQERVELAMMATEGTQMQLFRSSDRGAIGGVATDTVVSRYLRASTGDPQEFILAVWNPARASEFEVIARLFSPLPPPVEVDADTLANAVPFPRPQADRHDSNLRLSAGDVDYYRFVASQDRSVIYAAGYPTRNENVVSLELDIFDSEGRKVVTIFPDNWSDVQSLMDRVKINIAFGETEVGEEYFLRIANPLSVEVESRVVIY